MKRLFALLAVATLMVSSNMVADYKRKNDSSMEDNGGSKKHKKGSCHTCHKPKKQCGCKPKKEKKEPLCCYKTECKEVKVHPVKHVTEECPADSHEGRRQ